MAGKLKPVDDTPICDRAYLRRIDPVWMPGRVPKYFWEDVAHRRDYLLWLAHRLRFHRMKDFYRLEFSTISVRNYGTGLIRYWGKSALGAVQDCLPQYDWKAWLFPIVPPGFWDSPANRRSYMEWLGKELGFRRPEDWYRIQVRDITGRYGVALLLRFASLYDLMREYLPQLDWDRVDIHRPIKVEEVLAWADAHRSRHGTWPSVNSGEIPETGGSWMAIDLALTNGCRGLPGGTSLAKFLEKHRGARARPRPPPLSENRILLWADAYRAARGRWPTANSGPIPDTAETWYLVGRALLRGFRGLPGGSSLARLLAARRGARNRLDLPPLTEREILVWADAYFDAHGKWPGCKSGPIPATAETWLAVERALNEGGRGLRGNSSLARLLAARRGVRNPKRLPPFSERQILVWARAYIKAKARRPSQYSGPIAQSPGDTWMAVHQALVKGARGLPGGSSLAQLLRKRGLK